MQAFTTSEQVWLLAKDKRTHRKLETVAKAWGLEYIDMYEEWKHLCCSRDFLIPLVKLSGVIGDYEKARSLLFNCKEARTKGGGGGARGWAISDVRSAISKATELDCGQDLAGTFHARHPLDGARDAPTKILSDHAESRASRTRKRAREWEEANTMSEALTIGQSNATAQVTSVPPEQSGAVDAQGRRLSDVTGDSVDLVGVSSYPARSPRAELAITPAATSRCLPPTPVSATPVDAVYYSPGAADQSRSPSTTSEDRQSAQPDSVASSGAALRHDVEDSTIEISEGDLHLRSSNPAQEQTCVHNEAQHDRTDDDRIDILLTTFNPDPSLWYIVSTHLLKAGQMTIPALPGLGDAACIPRMMLIPVRGVEAAQWTLIIFDSVNAHSLVFDVGGSKEVAEAAWVTAEAFLVSNGVLQGEPSVNFDPFPSVRLSEDVTYGVFVVIVALHKLHAEPIDRISPKLWRALLAGFFLNTCQSSQERVKRLVANSAKFACLEISENVGLEQRIENAEIIGAAKRDVQAHAEEARRLLEMTESQLRNGARRKELDQTHKWLLAKPEEAGPSLDAFVTIQTKKVVSELRQLPVISDWCEQKLRLLSMACLQGIDECEKALIVLDAKHKTAVEQAFTAYQVVGAKLMSLNG